MPKKLLISLLFTWFSFVYGVAQQQRLNWVNAHALPIDSNGKYLAYLTSQLKGNMICGLAEASHGTHEFSVEKHRIISYLITHADYKSIGFEFGYSAMERINKYLLTGQGDLKKLMASLRLYNTKEIFDLFQSIKIYNDHQSLKNKVTIFGFDIDYFKADIDSSANYCINYLTKNTQLYTNRQAVIPVLKKITGPDFNNLYELEDDDRTVISHLNDEVKGKDNSAVKGSGLFKKHLSLLYQGTLVSNPLARDKFMAENLAGVQQENKVKTIIWGHNVHLAKDTTMAKCRAMGYYVRQKYGDQYYAIGFDTFKGSVNVIDDDKFEQHSFESQPGSFSTLLAQAKLPTFFISFNNTADDPLYNVDGNITNLFASWSDNHTLPIRPGIDFNGLIFIRETTHSIALD